ncbi:hypothetical protein CC80DRAFT_419000 [Byssothecium circinans]|uniref:Uncharacterized protein n=1 Tax=Byssothecium circinans TaxID=147558 RepID=A0A6A5TMS2_9PLEO|nr:hypothetical protein CC80DRAFT_419000 [Byssothecium circinans]
MPPWGRPPGDRGAGSVGKYLEETDDVYRFHEVDSDDEKNGVLLDSGFHKAPNGKQNFNPDELYFNDMDMGAWERRTGDVDGMAYGDDYGYMEDEGYYDDAADVTMAAAEYEELLFQRVLDKIRLARATGDADVQLLPEELEAYQARIWRSRTPAAHPQARSRPATAGTVNGNANPVVAASSSNTGTSGRKKNQRRTSLFSSKPKEKKSSGRSRAPSNVSEMASQPMPPGFVVPGPNGQPMYAPINAYQGGQPTQARGLGPALRLSQAPMRITGSRDMPGTFPGSPVSYRSASPINSPVHANRPASSSSRQSTQDRIEPQQLSNGRTRSSPIQETPTLVPFPTVEYKHHTAEPFQYQAAGHLASSSSSTVSQPQYTRRVASGSSDTHVAMPRRVPVPVQHATATESVHGSYSDPVPMQGGLGVDLGDEEDDAGNRKSSAKTGSGERKRKGKGKRKH